MSTSKREYMELTPDMLRYIRDNPETTSRDIADHFKLAVSTVSKMLGTFSDRGWIDRKKTHNMKRGVKPYACTITSQGKNKIDYCEDIENIMDKQNVDWDEAREIFRNQP